MRKKLVHTVHIEFMPPLEGTTVPCRVVCAEVDKPAKLALGLAYNEAEPKIAHFKALFSCFFLFFSKPPSNRANASNHTGNPVGSQQCSNSHQS